MSYSQALCLSCKIHTWKIWSRFKTQLFLFVGHPWSEFVGIPCIYAVSQDFIDVVFMFVREVRWAFTLLCYTLTFSFLLICTLSFFFCGQHLDDHLIKSRIIIKKKMEYNHCTILSLIVCNGFQSWKRLFCCTHDSFNMTMVSILKTVALIVILIEEHITVILIAVGMARCRHI
jgi:hypothetical protein